MLYLRKKDHTSIWPISWPTSCPECVAAVAQKNSNHSIEYIPGSHVCPFLPRKQDSRAGTEEELPCKHKKPFTEALDLVELRSTGLFSLHLWHVSCPPSLYSLHPQCLLSLPSLMLSSALQVVQMDYMCLSALMQCQHLVWWWCSQMCHI